MTERLADVVNAIKAHSQNRIKVSDIIEILEIARTFLTHQRTTKKSQKNAAKSPSLVRVVSHYSLGIWNWQRASK